MKKILILVSLLFLLYPVSASADPVKDGIEALRKNRYEEAVAFFSSAYAEGGKHQNAVFDLNFGISLAESARLYNDLYRLSVKLHADYLQRIASVAGKERSRYARLYLGRTLLEAGKAKEAAAALERFTAEKAVGEKYREVARAGLGIAYHRLGNEKKAFSEWARVRSTDPEVLTELARAYASAGIREKDAVAMADRAFKLVRASGKKPSAIVTANLLGVYAEAGLLERGFEVLSAAGFTGLEGYSYEERINENKTIRFYDTRLLADLGAFYGTAAIKFLNAASADAKLKGVAGFYLAETYGLVNDPAASEKSRIAALASGALPLKLNHRAEVMGVVNLFRSGKKEEALRRLKDYSAGSPQEALLTEALLACANLGIRCADAASKAEAAESARRGGSHAALEEALGRYFLAGNDLSRAVRYMEEGRDKGNKNKIEFNAPGTLTALSEAYCGTKQYSEALEIFFEMNKHFPAVRQLQVVMQGIYSMEHRSAGDVKIL